MAMTQELTDRINWHLEAPVCRTLTGLRVHLSLLGMSEIWTLCYWLRCETFAALTAKMWAMVKARAKFNAESHEREMAIEDDYRAVEQKYAEGVKEGSVSCMCGVCRE